VGVGFGTVAAVGPGQLIGEGIADRTSSSRLSLPLKRETAVMATRIQVPTKTTMAMAFARATTHED
jgi:hypothetical protein